jgi:hypothetical protein
MTPNNIEVVILLLLFFLPGYIYSIINSWFKFQTWDNKEILFLGFLFNSLIFQFISWQILKLFGVDIVKILSTNQTLNGFIVSNFWIITKQLLTTIAVSSLIALIFSLKQTKRLVTKIRFLLKNFLNPGLDYVPGLPGVFENDTNLGQKFIGCVIELKDGTMYDGNILHIGFDTENKDHIIVLNRVTRMRGDKKKKLPDELKILVPYDNINTIAYKEYPITKKSEAGFIGLNPLNLSLLLIIILSTFLLIVQKQVSNLDFLKTIIELFGAFVVTFLGVYISISYTKKSDQEKEKKEREKVYIGGLKLLASELSLNEQPLIPLSEAIDNIPDEPGKFYDNYGFLLEMTRDIKTDVFYGLVSSGAMDEISKSEDIFNKVQQAYYNTQKSINGIGLSREVFVDFANKPVATIPQDWIIMAKGIINNESLKLKRTIEMVQEAKKTIIDELGKYGVTFTEN